MDLRAYIVIEAAQHCLATIDKAHARAESAHDAGKFNGDVAAADNDDVLWIFIEMEHLVGGQGEFDAFDIDRHGRRAARGDQDLARRDGAVGLHKAQRVCVFELGALVDHLDARIPHVARIDARQPVDLAMHAIHEHIVVIGRVLDGPAIAFHVVQRTTELAGVDHVLLGDAAAHDARAACPVFLSDGDFRSRHGRQS